MVNHIHPIFEKVLGREKKEELLGQKSAVFWLTGLSGSGKSTLAIGLENELHRLGIVSELLDGDNIRTGLNKDLDFTEASRIENIRRIAEVAKLFCQAGIVTLCSFVSPTNDLRNLAKEIIGEENFFEVFVDASFETCMKRDVKGLYAKAMRGEIKNFTGLDAPFERPLNPYLTIDTENQSLEESEVLLINKVLEIVKPKEA